MNTLYLGDCLYVLRENVPDVCVDHFVDRPDGLLTNSNDCIDAIAIDQQGYIAENIAASIRCQDRAAADECCHDSTWLSQAL